MVLSQDVKILWRNYRSYYLFISIAIICINRKLIFFHRSQLFSYKIKEKKTVKKTLLILGIYNLRYIASKIIDAPIFKINKIKNLL